MSYVMEHKVTLYITSKGVKNKILRGVQDSTVSGETYSNEHSGVHNM
jgi:hypothetical protein